MHELGITRNIVAIVGDAAKGRPVRRVTVEIGKLSGVMPDAIAFCFDAVVKGTMLDGADLVIREIEGRACCSDCGRSSPSRHSSRPAPAVRVGWYDWPGDELNIKTMELEEAA